MRPVLPVALLASAALATGCGGSGQDATPTAPAAPSKSSVSTTGTLRVDSTGLHVGDATTGSSSGGVQVLPNTRVPPSEIHKQGVGAGASCENVDILPAPGNLKVVQDATLCLLNGERADQGLPALSDDAELDAAAVQHNVDMLKTQYFDHIAPDGSSPVDRIQHAGYIPKIGRWIVGENLAWGTQELSTPKNIVKAWMASTGHRENILNVGYKNIGFGIGVGNPRSKDGAGATYTTTFGGKDTPAVTASPAKRRAGRIKARRAKAARARASRTRSAKIKAHISKGHTH